MYVPSQHALTPKPLGLSQAVPTDARSFFYDTGLFKYRPFQNTAEVLAYLTTATFRTGLFPIFINSGTLDGSGNFTGGSISEWWFKNGVADGSLVEKPDPTALFKAGSIEIGAGTITGAPTPQRLHSRYSSALASGNSLNSLFISEQTIATTGNIQSVEGYTKTSHGSGVVALAIGTVGNVDHAGAGTVTAVRSMQAGGILSGVGTVTNWYGLFVQPAITGTGTITNLHGVYIPTVSAGGGTITNRYGVNQIDPAAINYFGGPVTLNTVPALGTPATTILVGGVGGVISSRTAAQVLGDVVPGDTATAAGTDTYTATLSPAITAYSSTLRVFINFTNANTGASTLNLNGLGVKSILKNITDEVAAGDLQGIHILAYDGTNFQVLNPNEITYFSTAFTGTGAVDDKVTLREFLCVSLSDLGTALTTGRKKSIRMPYAMTLLAPYVKLTADLPPTGQKIIVDIKEGGTTIFTTKISIDATEDTSLTAAVPHVMADIELADNAEIEFFIDQVGNPVEGAGLDCWLIGKRADA